MVPRQLSSTVHFVMTIGPQGQLSTFSRQTIVPPLKALRVYFNTDNWSPDNWALGPNCPGCPICLEFFLDATLYPHNISPLNHLKHLLQ